jgi:hypothetical protein
MLGKAPTEIGTAPALRAYQCKHPKVLIMHHLTKEISHYLQVFSMYGKWKVFRGDSTSPRDLLFTVKRTSIFQVKTSLGVFLAPNTSEQVCDFKVKASYFERSSAIYRGNSNTMVAQVS